MRGDFSRDTYDRLKHFSRVLQQQGRVQVDADWNEQTAIIMHYLRTLAADLIGPFGGPEGGLGFAIAEAKGHTFTIGAGRYYVDGILCENEREGATYDAQDDLPFAPPLKTGTRYIAYLDVWERHVTALEDDDIREKALGGPDTATRAKVVWQVKVDTLPAAMTTESLVRKNWKTVVDLWQPSRAGCLRARVERPEADTDPCLTAPDAKYRGAENQLYRIEIHRGGSAGEATFKWSRNNGAVSTRVTLSGTTLEADAPRGFTAKSWIELTSDAQELRGQPGTLVKLIKVDGNRLSLEGPVSAPDDVMEDEEWPTKARSWDTKGAGVALDEGAVPVSESLEETGWITIEHGIQIQFVPASADGTATHLYRTGDYWQIPARIGTGDIEWPTRAGDSLFPLSRTPTGIRHHYAPLAMLTPAGADWDVVDCRCRFSPQTIGCDKLPSFGEDGMGAPTPCVVPGEDDD
jgi:hypothetical protein